MASMQLYSYFRSSAAYRVRIGLHLKNLPFEYKAVHLVQNGGEQHHEDYRALNPAAEIPTLVHGSTVISQSMAILQYLDDVHPAPPLFPKDPVLKARTLQICEWVNSGIHPIQNLKVLQYLERHYGADEAAKARWAAHWVQVGFTGLEQFLKKTAGDFCVGNTLTAAELFLIPQVFNARRFNVDMEQFPTLAKIDARCKDMPAFVKAHPLEQPDAPAS